MSESVQSLTTDFAAIRTQLVNGPVDHLATYECGQKLFSLAERAAVSQSKDISIKRIAVVGSLTMEFLSKAIACGAALEGALALIYQAPFGSLHQEVFNPTSPLHAFRPDVVVLVPDWRTEIENLPVNTPADQVERVISEKVEQYVGIWNTLGGTLQARVIQHTLVPPPLRFCGPAERFVAASPGNQVATLNREMQIAANGTVYWVEMDQLAAGIGLDRFALDGDYYAAKLPFSLKWIDDYVLAFRAAWRGAMGCVKKVLALDLDNTLWGGVIGDDGPEGIVLGPGTAVGEAFYAWGLYLRQLRARGVILAVCSKNDPEIANAGLEHASQAVHRKDFAAVVCSWNDKASGLKRIAEQINVGVDSIVFVDDNPAECEQVRRALPEVAVIHLGTDPSRFIGLLDRGRWFDVSRYTDEDLGRATAYAARAQAQDEAAAVQNDMPRYLVGLRMVAKLAMADKSDLPRLAQLEQKTNQFNLTTRRLGEAAIAEYMNDTDAIVLSFRLADKFGDHGLVSSLIAVTSGNELKIESWLMSCRVFSRGAEQYIMRYLIGLARERALERISGQYIPTKKNVVVADLYERLGFARSPEADWWTLDLHDVELESRLVTFIAAAPPTSIAA